MAQKSKNKDFKKYLNFIIPVVIIVLLIILFFSYQNNSSSINNGEESEKSGLLNIFGSNLCDYKEGENCKNAPSRCSCKNDQLCIPEREKSDNLGCYTITCGDGYQDKGETNENCCADAGCPNGLVCNENLNQCVKPECPFDCCLNDLQYQDKSCPQHYQCDSQQYSCDPIDSDNDAFPDYLEIETGTDPNNPDTDGDTVLD